MSRPVILFAVAFGCGATAASAPPKALKEFTGHLTGSALAGFSRDGKRFASQAAAIEIGGSEVLVWDVATGKQTHKFPLSHGFAFDPTGDRLAIGLANGRRNELTVLDLKTGKAVWRLTEADAIAIGWPSYSPDGKVLYYHVEYLAADVPEVSIKTADAATGKAGAVLIDKKRGARRPVLSADGKRAVHVHYQTISVRDTATGKPTAKLSGHRYGVGSVEIIPGDKLLASTGRDDTVRVWDLATEKELWSGSHKGVGPLLVTPDGKRLFTGGEDETLRVWDVATGKQVAAHKLLAQVPLPENVPNGRGINNLRWSPDGKSVVVAGFDRAVKVFPVEGLMAPSAQSPTPNPE